MKQVFKLQEKVRFTVRVKRHFMFGDDLAETDVNELVSEMKLNEQVICFFYVLWNKCM